MNYLFWSRYWWNNCKNWEFLKFDGETVDKWEIKIENRE